MIYLHTGAPGAGKTLSAVEFIAMLQRERPDRVVYTNINGISLPGAIAVDTDWCANWFDNATQGAIIVIDEAQKIWRSTRGGDPPKAVTDLETHRHDGIDIVMVTQHPTLIHANIRKLVTRHVHLVEFTKKSSLRWEWREAHDDVQEDKLRASGDFTEWQLPVRHFEHYISAADHTRRTPKPKMRAKARIAQVVLGLCLLLAIIAGIRYVPGLMAKAKGMTEAHSDVHVISRSTRSFDPTAPAKPRTASEWVQSQIPRIATQPYSAPIYDGQEVTQHPRIFCIVPENPADCRCITEQGTPYKLDVSTCNDVALNGPPYDPYKPLSREADTSPSARTPVNTPPSRPTAPAITAAAPLPPLPGASGMAGKGRATATIYAPPAYSPSAGI